MHAFSLHAVSFTPYATHHTPHTALFAPQTQSRLRRVMIRAILSTDMALHFEQSKKLAGIGCLTEDLDAKEEDSRQLVVDLVIHSADLRYPHLCMHAACLRTRSTLTCGAVCTRGCMHGRG